MGSGGGNWAVTRVPRAANFWYFKYQISISYFLDVTLIAVIFFFWKCFFFLSLSSWWWWKCKQADLSWRKWKSFLHGGVNVGNTEVSEHIRAQHHQTLCTREACSVCEFMWNSSSSMHNLIWPFQCFPSCSLGQIKQRQVFHSCLASFTCRVWTLWNRSSAVSVNKAFFSPCLKSWRSEADCSLGMPLDLSLSAEFASEQGTEWTGTSEYRSAWPSELSFRSLRSTDIYTKYLHRAIFHLWRWEVKAKTR